LFIRLEPGANFGSRHALASGEEKEKKKSVWGGKGSSPAARSGGRQSASVQHQVLAATFTPTQQQQATMHTTLSDL